MSACSITSACSLTVAHVYRDRQLRQDLCYHHTMDDTTRAYQQAFLTGIREARSGNRAAQVLDAMRAAAPEAVNSAVFWRKFQEMVDLTFVRIIDTMFDEATTRHKHLAFKTMRPLVASVEPQITDDFLAHTLQTAIDPTMAEPELNDFLLICEITVLAVCAPAPDASLLREFHHGLTLVKDATDASI